VAGDIATGADDAGRGRCHGRSAAGTGREALESTSSSRVACGTHGADQQATQHESESSRRSQVRAPRAMYQAAEAARPATWGEVE
jgi:hypothetical protein